MSYDDFFLDKDSHFRQLVKRVFREIAELEKTITSGAWPGDWEVKPIKKPGVRGYVAEGRFQLEEPLTLPQRATDEIREPLVDVFDEENYVKVYIELPGVERENIQLSATESQVEVKAKTFHKNIDIPTENIEFDRASATYKNGVLEVTIPKTVKTGSQKDTKTIKID